MDMSAIYPSRMQLNNLKWETSTEYNLGGDFSFFHGKLRLTFEWYNKYIKDLLQKEPKMPTTTGFSKNNGTTLEEWRIKDGRPVSMVYCMKRKIGVLVPMLT